MTDQTRENWLNQAAELLFTLKLDAVADSAGVQRRPFKISVGQCGAQKVIGQCWPSQRSDDNINEIFIAPHIDDSSVILSTLTHELVHALDDCENGHKGRFAKMARAANLEGKLTATTSGPELQLVIDDIIDALGTIPHARLDTTPRKTQSTRMLLVECTDPSCGWRFRATKKHVENININRCLCCGQELKVPA